MSFTAHLLHRSLASTPLQPPLQPIYKYPTPMPPLPSGRRYCVRGVSPPLEVSSMATRAAARAAAEVSHVHVRSLSLVLTLYTPLPRVPPLPRVSRADSFSPDASRLALAASDGAVSLMKLPPRRHYTSATPTLPTLNGHTGRIHSVHWSHSGRLLLLGSADGSASLWDVAHDKPPAAPLLSFQHVHHSPNTPAAASGTGAATDRASAASSGGNPKFGHEVRDARFFYLDRLLLIAAGPAVQAGLTYCPAAHGIQCPASPH